MLFLNPSLLIAAGASFFAGVLGYIIVRLWIKPITGYTLTKGKLDHELTRYRSRLDDAGGTGDSKADRKHVEAMLLSARKYAMDLASRYHREIPYWYRLMLDSRQESPADASGLLTNLNKIRDVGQRKARIDAARKALRLPMILEDSGHTNDLKANG